MLRTELNDGPGGKLVLCWNASFDTDESAVEHTERNDDLVEKVNGLYETVSKFSAEFVQCMRQIQNLKHSDTGQETLNLSFKISDPSTPNQSFEEISKLRQEIEELRLRNQELEGDLKCKIADISTLERTHEQDKRQLRNKYQKDMSELRIYFEKICHSSYERDVTNNFHNPKSNTNLDDGITDEDCGTNYLSFDGVINNCKEKSKETIGSNLKTFIINAYQSQVQKFKDDFNTKKDVEMGRLKEDNMKYSKMIETLQSEVNRLVREKTVENNVREIHRNVRKQYETELEELQDISDNEFLRKMNNDKETLEKEFKCRFENAFNELNDEWESKVEVLSELLVKSTIKYINSEETSSKIMEEKKVLELKLLDCMKALFPDKNTANFEEITEELMKMKRTYDCKIDQLQKENTVLHNKLEDFQQRIPPANSSREKVITMLIDEITDLLTKEQLGEDVTWPTELSTLERVFSKKFHSIQDLEHRKKGQCSLFTDQISKFESDDTDERLDNSLDLNQLLKGRERLRKMNVALRGVINMFTRYLTNCEDECNNTLIGALVNAEKLKKLDAIRFETFTSDMDLTTNSIEDESKTLRFPSNVSAFLNLIDETDYLNTNSGDRSISVTGSDLKSWLQIVRNEASVVLQLISDQKNDANCEKRSNRDESVQTTSLQTDSHDEGIQTVLSGHQLKKNEEKITILQNSLQKAEDKLSELEEKTSYLEGYLKPAESIEGYGEAKRMIRHPNCLFNSLVIENDEELESDLEAVCNSENYCVKCDDFQKQIRYMQNLLEQNKKHLERQTLERDCEREEYDKQIKSMEVEREIHLSNKEKFKYELTLLEQQIKEQSSKLEEDTELKDTLETKCRLLEKQLKALQDEDSVLKKEATARNELVKQLEKKLKTKEDELKTQQKHYQKLLDELDSFDEIRAKQVQEFSDVHVSSSNICDKMKKELLEIEKVVTVRTRLLENAAVVAVTSSVVSSPSASASEDISYEQRTRLFSPIESDLSSSPGRSVVSFDVLSCLHDKLNKLFRAEDASFKKIRDQEMQLAKIIDEMKDLELERNTLSESLRATSDKLSQTKRELENWRIGQQASPYQSQSTIHLQHTAKIHKLQSEIKHYKEYLSRKDDCDETFLRTVTFLLSTVSNSRFEAKDTVETHLLQLRTKFEELIREKKNLQEQFAVLLDDVHENYDSPKRKIRRLARNDAFAPADGNTMQRSRHISFADYQESYNPETDVTRRAPAAIVSPVPRLTPAASVDDSSSNKIRRLNLSENTSIFDTQPLNLRPNLEVEGIFISKTKESENNNSISIDSNVAAFGSSIEFSAEKSNPSGQDSSLLVNKHSKEVTILRDSIEREKKRHLATVSAIRQLKRTNKLRVEDELNNLMTDSEEKGGELLGTELHMSLEQHSHSESEESVHSLTRELKTSIAMMERLEQELQEVERKFADEIVGYRNRCQESKDVCAAVVKERISVEWKYEQLSKTAKELHELLLVEKSKSVELSVELGNMQNEVANLKKMLESEKELVLKLTKANESLKTELERANSATIEDKTTNPGAIAGIEGRSESLRDLTGKVQKEVELAAELDEHLLKNLESTSESSSLLNYLFNSSTLSQDLKRVLFKLLQDGCENLAPEDKKVLIESFDLLDTKNFEQLEELNNKLNTQLESEKMLVAELMKEKNYLNFETKRLETVLAYYDERITFLVAKVDDYRNRYVKNEIELTATRCTRNQFENQVHSLKNESRELKTQFETHVQKYANEKKVVMKENLDLKQTIDTLKNQIEALTAEMNSIKAISQYHSDSENELSRTLYPLKSRLAEVQRKYAHALSDFEVVSNEVQKLKLNLKFQQLQARQLEERHQSTLQAKRDLEGELIEVKTKHDDLIWKKQKLEEKLRAFELAETRARRVRVDKNNSARRENDLMRRHMEDEYKRLEQNILKIKDNFNSLHYSWKEVCEKSQKLFHRMMIAEKNQRALVYQKNYLFTRGYNETTLVAPSLKRKFKSVVIAVIWLRRIEFLNCRRLDHGRQKTLEYLTYGSPNVKVYPWFDFIVDPPKESDRSDPTREFEKSDRDVEFLLIDDSLKALYQQYMHALSKYD